MNHSGKDLMSKLIVGCGYLGARVARLWRDAGEPVFVTTRSHQRSAELAASGWEPIVADVTCPETLRGLPRADTVLVAFGYDPSAGRSRSEVYADGLANLLKALDADTRRIVYVSSTGVYGQHHGAWVTEETPCRPEREAGRAFLAAEQRLAEHPLGRRSVVLRMAGLYGPSRVPRPRGLLSGEPLAVASDSFLNLIHVDDMVQVVAAACKARLDEDAVRHHGQRPTNADAPIASGNSPRLYLASDGHPVQRREYFRFLAERLGAPEPTFVEPDPQAAAQARGGGSKRVSNAKLLQELGVTMRWPSYREGLGGGSLEQGAWSGESGGGSG